MQGPLSTPNRMGISLGYPIISPFPHPTPTQQRELRESRVSLSLHIYIYIYIYIIYYCWMEVLADLLRWLQCTSMTLIQPMKVHCSNTVCSLSTSSSAQLWIQSDLSPLSKSEHRNWRKLWLEGFCKVFYFRWAQLKEQYFKLLWEDNS